MHNRCLAYLLSIFLTTGFLTSGSVLATDTESKASSAVTNILFEYDASEFASYVVSETGRLDITFARNTPDNLYSEILNKLQNHPDIKGVLSGKSGPHCSRF